MGVISRTTKISLTQSFQDIQIKMPRRYSYDYEEDRYWEWREEQEEEERWYAWRDEVDEHCECVWENEEEAAMLKYCRVPWKAPVEMCAFHVRLGEEAAAEEAERAAAEARAAEEWRRVEEEAAARRAAAAAEEAVKPLHIRVAAAEILARAKLGQHKYRQPISYIQARLNIIQKGGLTPNERIDLIREIFAYLAQPESHGLLVEHTKFRNVVQMKINEFRGDARVAEIEGIMDQVEGIIASIEAPVIAA